MTAKLDIGKGTVGCEGGSRGIVAVKDRAAVVGILVALEGLSSSWQYRPRDTQQPGLTVVCPVGVALHPQHLPDGSRSQDTGKDTNLTEDKGGITVAVHCFSHIRLIENHTVPATSSLLQSLDEILQEF